MMNWILNIYTKNAMRNRPAYQESFPQLAGDFPCVGETFPQLAAGHNVGVRLIFIVF
jgi:hypothetical protein